LGTLAGDDTIFIAPRRVPEINKVKDLIIQLLELS
ncbi:MAG: hypothetical protein ACKN8Y_05745, partial [Polynucleobacter victoriensis]